MSNAFDPTGNTNRPVSPPTPWWGGSPVSPPMPDGQGAINLNNDLHEPVMGMPPGGGVVSPSQPQGTGQQNTLTPQAGFAGANYTKGFDEGGDVDGDDDGANSGPAPAGGGRYPSLEQSHGLVDKLIEWAQNQYKVPLTAGNQDQSAADGGAINVAPQPQQQGPSAAAMQLLTHANRASPAHVQILERGAPAQHPADKALLAIGRAAQAHPEAGFAVMQHYLAQYDHLRNFAKAALAAGHPDKAAQAATAAYNALPDGAHVSFAPGEDGGLVAQVGDQEPDQQEAAGQEQGANAGGLMRGSPNGAFAAGGEERSYEDGTDQPVPAVNLDDDDDPDKPASPEGMGRVAGQAAEAIGNKVRDVAATLRRSGETADQAEALGPTPSSGAGWEATKQGLASGANTLQNADAGAFAAKGAYKLSPAAASKALDKPAFQALDDGSIKTLSDAVKLSPNENDLPTDTTGYSSEDERAPAGAQSQAPEQKPEVSVEDARARGWSEAERQAGHKFSNEENRQALEGVTRATTDFYERQNGSQSHAAYMGSPNERILSSFANAAKTLAPGPQAKLMRIVDQPGAGTMTAPQLVHSMAIAGIHPLDMNLLMQQAGVPQVEIDKLVAPYKPAEGEQTTKPKATPRLGEGNESTGTRSSGSGVRAAPRAATSQQSGDGTGYASERHYQDREAQRKHEENMMAARQRIAGMAKPRAANPDRRRGQSASDRSAQAHRRHQGQ